MSPVDLISPTAGDHALIECWLHAEHVQRWWGDPHENSALLQNLPESAQSRLIVADGRKIGLVSWQHPSRVELDDAGLEDVPGSVVDIDIMIGEQEQMGRGFGTAAIKLVAEQALASPAVPFVIAATSVENTVSQRAFAKAGFRVDREFDDPLCGRSVLMVLRRQT
jgi:aminoglycoside 6'-N-acetyltransferase